jgi:hypothetical protein
MYEGWHFTQMWKRDVQKKPYYDMKVTFSRLDDITAKTRARANRVNLEEEATSG